MIEDSAKALKDCRPLIVNIVDYLKKELPPLVNQGYDNDPPPMKAATPDEHDENLNNFLMYIEEALLQFRVCLSQEAQHVATKVPQPPKGPPGKVQRPNELAQITIHGAGDDSDDDPDTGLGERPWTRSELKEKAQTKL